MLGMAPDVNALLVVPKFTFVLLFLLVHFNFACSCFVCLILLSCTLIFRSSFRHGKALEIDSYALHICIFALNQI